MLKNFIIIIKSIKLIYILIISNDLKKISNSLLKKWKVFIKVSNNDEQLEKH